MEENQKILIDISGQKFVTSRRTLFKYPYTRLGKLASSNETVLEFEGETEIFQEILKFYWTDKLHCPKNVCFDDFKTNLDFWELDYKFISDCCAGEMHEETSLKNQFAFFDRKIRPDEGFEKSAVQRLQFRLWSFLTDPTGEESGCRYLAAAWAIFYLIVTVSTGIFYASTTALLRKSMETLKSPTSALNISQPDVPGNDSVLCEELLLKFNGAENARIYNSLFIATGIFFTCEVWARFLSCPKKIEFLRSRNVTDLLVSLFESCVALFFLALRSNIKRVETGRFSGNEDELHLVQRCEIAYHLDFALVFVNQLRMTRLLYYASAYGGLKVLLITLYRSWKEIVLLVVLITMAVLIFAPIVYFLSQTEITAPNSIRDIPSAYWFVLVTMTTVGYGDIYPTELGGYIGTMIVMICGLMVTALPVAIIGGNFTVVYEYNEKYKKQRRVNNMKDNDRSSVDICQVEHLTVENMV